MKLEFEPDPSSLTRRERLVIIKFRFGGYHQKCCVCAEKCRERWPSKSVSAVVINFMSLRCACAINSAAKPIVQLRKYSVAYQAQQKYGQILPTYSTPFFSRASGRDKTLAAERFLTFAAKESKLKHQIENINF